MKLFQDEEEEIGEVFQDETNMAALLFYKQGGSDEYRMVRHHDKFRTYPILHNTCYMLLHNQ